MSNSIQPGRTISENGLLFIKAFEGLRLKAYYDQVGVVTIGYGSTHTEYGQPIKITDQIGKPRAEQLLKFEARSKALILTQSLDKFNIQLNQNQYDALLSLAYNIGMAGLLGSTLFRIIKLNPLDPNITKAFCMWCKGTINGKKVTLPGLLQRRQKEAELYFS